MNENPLARRERERIKSKSNKKKSGSCGEMQNMEKNVKVISFDGAKTRTGKRTKRWPLSILYAFKRTTKEFERREIWFNRKSMVVWCRDLMLLLAHTKTQFRCGKPNVQPICLEFVIPNTNETYSKLKVNQTNKKQPSRLWGKNKAASVCIIWRQADDRQSVFALRNQYLENIENHALLSRPAASFKIELIFIFEN